MLTRKFSESTLEMIREQLAEFARRCVELQSACVCTRDGLMLADYPTGSVTSRSAVMAGTMHTLATTISSASALASCQNVTIESNDGYMILLAVPGLQEDLVLTAVAGRNTSLGMLLCLGRECSEQIAACWSSEELFSPISLRRKSVR